MISRLITSLLLLVCSLPCHAQEKGCFLPKPGDGVELVTTIDFSKFDVFFVGEFHGVYGMPEVKLALIKYLNKNMGITDIFMEMGYSAAYLYNSFLATGDEAFITHPQLIYSAKKPDLEFWNALYEYNKGLEHKLTIRGIDFERMEFLKVLKFMAPPERERPREIAGILAYIDTVRISAIGWLSSEAQKKQDSAYQRIRADMDTNRQLYKQYYGDDYKVVKQILLNENTFANFSDRNNGMYQNIEKQVSRDSIEKFIVFSGLAHGNKEHKGSVYSLLAQNKKYKHSIVNIAMACKNCYDWQQAQNGIAPYKAPYTYYKDTALMNTIYNKHFNEDCRYTLFPCSAIDDKKVSKYSDYLILMKDQPEY